ncbi:MAG: RNA 3'-terminal phosphate cyclase, partial [Verrucomicrobiales bacterium]
MITIDGADGGGQVLRTALSLSAVTGEAFRMVNIRGQRRKPGLMRQHLTCVRAAAEICGAKLAGAEIGSREITFWPGELRAGRFDFAIGTAGSTSLVLQTVLPALACAGEASEIRVAGGTHNPLAPSSDYLQKAYLP